MRSRCRQLVRVWPGSWPARSGPLTSGSWRRRAVQVAVASGAVLVAAQFLAGERWYWAVGTGWWIFANTASRGETLVRDFCRVLGTATGIAVGFLVAIPFGGAAVGTGLLVAVCAFGVSYAAAVSYTWTIFFVLSRCGSVRVPA
ncbi:FUSC family protein [Streptomyces sp. NPDC127166]|uniref:FUSC family protein n=1 Tax=Streptomyces sp. NPDC127166 TaxID=3345380 RepID=UPI0036355F27